MGVSWPLDKEVGLWWSQGGWCDKKSRAFVIGGEGEGVNEHVGEGEDCQFALAEAPGYSCHGILEKMRTVATVDHITQHWQQALLQYFAYSKQLVVLKRT